MLQVATAGMVQPGHPAQTEGMVQWVRPPLVGITDQITAFQARGMPATALNYDRLPFSPALVTQAAQPCLLCHTE
jgi:hypothetical protein